MLAAEPGLLGRRSGGRGVTGASPLRPRWGRARTRGAADGRVAAATTVPGSGLGGSAR